MKILYIKHGMHFKNHNSIMSYKNITLYVIENPDILNKMDLSSVMRDVVLLINLKKC